MKIQLPMLVVTDAVLESPRADGDTGPDHVMPRVEINLGLTLFRQQLFEAARGDARERFEELLDTFVQWSLLKQAGVRVVPPTIDDSGMSNDIDLRSLLHVVERQKT